MSLWHTQARLLQQQLSRELATRTSTTKQTKTQGKVAVSKQLEDDFIPTCRGKWTNEEYQCEANHRETINHNIKRYTKIFSRGSRACRHASPRCVNQYYMVRWLIGNPHPSSPRAPQEPTASEVTQWHTQYIRATLWLFHWGRCKAPHKSLEPATNNLQLMPDLLHYSKPSRWWQPPRETRIPQQKNTQVPTRCKLTSKCT
jgi:hypothetical protein